MNGWLLVAYLGALNTLLMLWVVLGFGISFRLLKFPDLTPEASLPLGAGVYAVIVSGGHSPWLAAVMAIASGALAGAVTAALHVLLGVNKLLAGVIVIAIAYSTTLGIMGAPNIGLTSSASLLSSQSEGRALLQLAIVACAGMPLLAAFLAGRIGLRLRVAAVNRDFARSIGVSPAPRIIAGLALTNALCAFSGVLLTNVQGFADIGMGQGIVVLALASLGIGEAIQPLQGLPAHFAVLATSLAGTLLYQEVVSIAFHLGLPATVLKLSTGVLVLVVVAIQALRSPQTHWREVMDT
jgi:putative ABC transport system permease protein